MELRRKINASIESCYQLLLESFIMDANDNGESITIDNLSEGFSFRKPLKTKLGNTGHVLVTLVAMTQNEAVKIAFDSAQGINTIQYQLNIIDDENFELVYADTYEGSSNSKNLNYKMMEFVTRRRLRKTGELTLDHIERILKQ